MRAIDTMKQAIQFAAMVRRTSIDHQIAVEAGVMEMKMRVEVARHEESKAAPTPSARTDELALAAATEIMGICSDNGLHLYGGILAQQKARIQCIVQRAIDEGRLQGKPVAWRFIDDEDGGHISYSGTPPTKAQADYLQKWKRPAWTPLYTSPPLLFK